MTVKKTRADVFTIYSLSVEKCLLKYLSLLKLGLSCFNFCIVRILFFKKKKSLVFVFICVSMGTHVGRGTILGGVLALRLFEMGPLAFLPMSF